MAVTKLRSCFSRGGAVLVKEGDPAFHVRITRRLQERRAICATPLKYITSGQTIFMNTGSTTSIMAEFLAGPSEPGELTIITNSLDVASRLALPLDAPPARHRGHPAGRPDQGKPA